jgi:hypothetical protein
MSGFKVKSNNVIASSSSNEFLNPKILVVLPKHSSGTAVNGTVYKDIITPASGLSLFGEKSPMNAFIQEYFRLIRPAGQSRAFGDYRTKLNAVSYAVTGTVGVRNIALSGTPVDGSISLFVSSEKYNKITIATLSTETLAQIATKIANALNAVSNQVFTATTSSATVILTASIAGEWFNSEVYNVISNTSGLTLTHSIATAGVGIMDVSALITKIEKEKYDYIYIPYESITEDILAFIKARGQQVENVSLGGLLYFGIVGKTIAEASDIQEAHQSDMFVQGVFEKLGQEKDSAHINGCKAMTTRAMICSSYSNQDFMTKRQINANDGIGGSQFKPVNLTGCVVLGKDPYAESVDYSKAEEDLLDEMGFVYFKNRGNVVIFGNEQTTYSLTSTGEIPEIRKTGETDAFLSSLYIVEFVHSEFDGSILANQSLEGSPQVTTDTVATGIEEGYGKMAALGWVAGDPESTAKFSQKVRSSIKANFTSGSVSADTLTTILGGLNEVLISNIASK